MVNLFPVEAGYYKADGGACFGVVPKKIWGEYFPADHLNLITISQRCLLVEEPGSLTLIDTGMGDKQSDKFYSYQHRHGDFSLVDSVKSAGFSPGQVTDVIFTHLHYDHCGGALMKQNNELVFTFPNAVHWCSKQQWEWANNPNPREGASYFEENYKPLYESGKLKFIYDEGMFSENITLKLFHGHTAGQIIPLIKYKNRIIAYMADFIPSVAHIPVPYVPSFDTNPLISMKEKEAFLAEAFKNRYLLFFEHDYLNECCSLVSTPKGIRAGNVMQLSELCGAQSYNEN